MKKISKQIIALALLMGLILSSLSPTVALAADKKGTITVDNPKEGKTYTLYRVFDLTYNQDAGAYTYTVAKEDFETTLFGKYPQLDSGKTMKKGGVDYKIINAEPLRNPNYKYTPPGESEEISGYINPYDFSIWLQDKTANFVDVGTPDAITGTGWINLNPLGYFMIKSDAGTVVSLTTTDPDATVYEKNILPTLTKKVKGGTATDFADSTYANIGEELEFKITFDVHNHANTEYVLKDIVPAGIDISENSLEVKLETDSMTTTNQDQKLKYELPKGFTSNDPDDGKKNLEIKFPLETIQAIAASLREADKTVDGTKLGTKKTITVTYTGELNNSANMSNHEAFLEANSNRNKAELIYDKHDEQNPLKAEAHADVRTTDFNIFKYAVKTVEGGDNTNLPLANAKFKIYPTEGSAEPIKFNKVGEGEDYFYNTEGDVKEITTKVSNPANPEKDGKFSIKGLKPGTYYIEETVAPDGFNQLQERIPLTITGTVNEVTYSVGQGSEGTLDNNTVKIENQSGAVLPETGGMGRTLIYTLGAIIFFGSLILLIARKRTKQDNA